MKKDMITLRLNERRRKAESSDRYVPVMLPALLEIAVSI
jgi:hypothetical protein